MRVSHECFARLKCFALYHRCDPIFSTHYKKCNLSVRCRILRIVIVSQLWRGRKPASVLFWEDFYMHVTLPVKWRNWKLRQPGGDKKNAGRFLRQRLSASVAKWTLPTCRHSATSPALPNVRLCFGFYFLAYLAAAIFGGYDMILCI